ncbi:hypothetical protein [Oceanobacillus kimchii]|uniref:hypothetical protein n=1 Tax=Oceanobacillus kimchii TaxID=746691 RepID=UPI003B02B80A
MVHVNESILRIKTSPYRVPMRGMKAGGHYEKSQQVQSKSTSAGGGTTVTSSSGGGSTTSAGGSQTTSAGGSTVVTSDATGFNGILTTTFPFGDDMEIHTHNVNLATSQLQHSHPVRLPNHTHTVSNHTHSVSNHTHSISLSPHRHDFEVTIPAISIPDHTHEQTYGIHEVSSNVSRLTVKIDGVTVPFSGTEGEIDITQYLEKDSDGKVQRSWHRIEVQPNDFARIDLILSNRFFIQSKIGGNY